MSNAIQQSQPIIIGGGYNAYGLIRSLGEVGIFPILICGQRISPPKYSRYISCAWIISGNGEPNRRSREQIFNKLDQLNKTGLLIPTDEAWVVELLDYGREYRKYGAVYPFCSHDVTRLCLGKDEFALWCNKNGVLVPRSINFLTGTDWADFLREVSRLTFPVVVKPKTKGLGDDGLGFNFYRIFYDYKELLLWAERFDQEGPNVTILAQEFIPGPVENLVSLQGYVDNNEKIWASQYVKLRQTQRELGCTNVAVIQNCDDDVIELNNEILLNKLKFRGFFDVEFKRHQENKQLYLIEINPRPGMLNYAATLMGLNLPAIALEDLCHYKFHHSSFNSKQKTGWVWARLIDDFLYEVKNALSRRILSPWRIFNKWYAPYKDKKMIIDPMWSTKDVKPGLTLLFIWFLEPLRHFLILVKKFIQGHYEI